MATTTIIQFATGTAPALTIYDYGYASFAVLVVAIFLVLFIVAILWFEDWVIFGIEAFLYSVKKTGTQPRAPKTK